jgi:hypothetical protein
VLGKDDEITIFGEQIEHGSMLSVYKPNVSIKEQRIVGTFSGG